MTQMDDGTGGEGGQAAAPISPTAVSMTLPRTGGRGAALDGEPGGPPGDARVGTACSARWRSIDRDYETFVARFKRETGQR